MERNLWSNLQYLTPHDELKLVLADRADYDWAVARIAEHGLAGRCPILMAPVQGRLEPGQLADWILADGLEGAAPGATAQAALG